MAERDRLRDEFLAQRDKHARRRALEEIESAVDRLTEITDDGQVAPGQVYAIRTLFQLAGIKEFQNQSLNIQMQQTVVNEAEVREARRKRLKSHLSGSFPDRFGAGADE